jgi:hypothetical protein
MLTPNEKLALAKDRLAKLDGSPKNIKAPGVCRKLRRTIRNMEKVTNA